MKNNNRLYFARQKFLGKCPVCGKTLKKVDGVNTVSYTHLIEPQMIHDPYIRDRIYNMIKKKIRQAKIGVLKVRGNFAIIGGDPYSLMQSIFGLPVTGLRHAGECWHKHWLDREAVSYTHLDVYKRQS